MGTNGPRTRRGEEIDLGSVLATVGREDPDGRHRVTDTCQAEFTWDYEKGTRPRLEALYEKAKQAQWNARTDLPWDADVDQERLAAENRSSGGGTAGWSREVVEGTRLAHWDERDWRRFGVEYQNWLLSQFLHGEQGALLCTAKIVETVPWIDAKYYAATQVMDEARHVEVFSRYLDEKLSGHYVINAHLGLLLDDVIADARWDITYLGMQIMVEGLALAAFGFLRAMTTEPLLKQILRYVMADEARHVAFGVVSLQDYYAELTAAELRDRQEFALDAAVRMKDRMQAQEVWDRLGVPPADVATVMARTPDRAAFEVLLFSKIVPNLKKLGLLDASGGWLRERLGALGVIGFEDLADAEQEADAEADASPAARGVS